MGGSTQSIIISSTSQWPSSKRKNRVYNWRAYNIFMKNQKGKFAHITLSITVRERMFGYPRKEGGWKE